ncbi:MAG TPA: cupin domain-containing protein [Candidatus Binatia bacterium]
MKKSLTVLGLAAVLAIAGLVGSAHSAEKKGKPVIFANPDDAKYKDVAPGVSRAVLWGNPDKGPYGAYTKFKPGADNGMHTHTNDVWIVVVKGAYLYKDDAGEKRVGPGSFIRIPGKLKHWSGGDAKEGAVFYEEGAGKFDLIPAK